MKNRLLLAAGALFVLSACSGGPRIGEPVGRLTDRERERFLPPQGDPGMVAAADIAFAKAAREDGQWTAFRHYAASDAVLHGVNGVIPAGPFLEGQQDPAQSVNWVPRAIWSSCDGSLAVSFGRYAEPDGIVGSYTTVWVLQGDGDYRWVYDLGGPDDPQPPAPTPRAEPAPGEDVIVVPGLTSIEGKVADCIRDGVLPDAPLAVIADNTVSTSAQSRDGTLQWRWEQHANGDRRVVVDYLREGEWEQALDFAVPATEAP